MQLVLKYVRGPAGGGRLEALTVKGAGLRDKNSLLNSHATSKYDHTSMPPHLVFTKMRKFILGLKTCDRSGRVELKPLSAINNTSCCMVTPFQQHQEPSSPDLYTSTTQHSDRVMHGRGFRKGQEKLHLPRFPWTSFAYNLLK